MEVVWVEGVGDEAGVWRPLASPPLETKQRGRPCGDWRVCPMEKVPLSSLSPPTPTTHTLAVGGLADCVCEFPGVSGRGGGGGVPGGGTRTAKVRAVYTLRSAQGRLHGESLLWGQEKA